ncbi:MAG: hypothetical protein PWQ72_831, partial [Pseudothermotoga sp.]|nr:hypothetical protein [Pseudothermotoga sp.]
ECENMRFKEKDLYLYVQDIVAPLIEVKIKSLKRIQ